MQPFRPWHKGVSGLDVSGQVFPGLPWCCPVGSSVVRISMEHAAVSSGFIVKVWVPIGKQTHCSHRVNGCPSVGYMEGGIAMGTLRLQIKSPCEIEAKTPLWSSGTVLPLFDCQGNHHLLPVFRWGN